jgi:hypothetical protein
VLFGASFCTYEGVGSTLGLAEKGGPTGFGWEPKEALHPIWGLGPEAGEHEFESSDARRRLTLLARCGC